MKRMMVFFFFFLLLIWGCSKNNNIINPPSNSTGGISFKIDPHSVPTGVILITANLTRTGFTSITQNLDLLSDSTAELTIPAIQIGTWHLKVDAKGNDSTILYTGETDVIVQENVVVQLNLTLNPVSSGTGAIYIFVTWGTRNMQWIDFGGNPMLTRNNNPSLPNAVASGKVLFDNGIYKMWYSAIYNNGVANIWYAESQNGTNWNTVGSSPVLTPGISGSWDDLSIIPSVVLKESNIYKLYYMGCRSFTDMLNIGLAYSADGIHWTKYNTPVINANDQYYMIGLTEIIKKDSTYLAYFNYNSSRSTENNKIGMATSFNGVNWVIFSGNPILVPTLEWEGGSIHGSSVIFDNNKFKMVYSNLIQQTAFGMATSSDGFNFTKQSEPFFRKTNSVNNFVRIAYPNYRKFNNVYYIYYTGQTYSGEMSICVTRNFGN